MLAQSGGSEQPLTKLEDFDITKGEVIETKVDEEESDVGPDDILEPHDLLPP